MLDKWVPLSPGTRCAGSTLLDRELLVQVYIHMLHIHIIYTSYIIYIRTGLRERVDEEDLRAVGGDAGDAT